MRNELIYTFGTEGGRVANYRIAKADPGVTASMVNTSMDTILAQRALATSSGPIVSKIRARMQAISLKEFDVTP